MTKESSFDLDIYMALQYNEKKLKITIGRGRRRKKKMKELQNSCERSDARHSDLPLSKALEAYTSSSQLQKLL